MRGFVFKSVFGERPDLCAKLLEVTLEMEVSDITVKDVTASQSEFEIELPGDLAGGRLDLYVVDADGNHYDVEVQASKGYDELLRARRYQSLMDVKQLKQGHKAKELRRSVVVFICDFDPLDDGLMRYDCRTCCLQTREPVDDGRLIVFLNVGAAGEAEGTLGSLMRLFAKKRVDNDQFIREIMAEMRKCVDKPGWMEQFMTWEEEIERAANARYEEGREEGIELGREEGRKDLLARLVREGMLTPEQAAHYATMDTDAD